MITSEEIVACARGWLGTRFHHQGRVKKTETHKGGVDCLGLLIGVARELNLRSGDGTPLIAFDKTDYSHSPDTAFLKDRLGQALCSVPSGRFRSGDIALLAIEGNPQHMAIVSDTPTGYGLIHAYAPARAVVEHGLDLWWQERIAGIYRIA